MTQSLHDALSGVARQLNLDKELLWLYSEEDTLKGFYDKDGSEYDIPYKEDGQFLYALIRALKPNQVLEIGTRFGGSARHILEALEKNNNGYLITLDTNPNATIKGIPKHLRERCTLVYADAEQWIKDYTAISDIQGFDFIHEDGSHSIHLVHAIYDMLPSLMPNGGVIVSHDVSTGVGDDIMQGIKNAGFEPPPIYIYDGSPCGFSVMKYEGNKHE